MSKSLNDIDLGLLENLAAQFFTPWEIALMMDVPEAEFVKSIKTEGSRIRSAFYKGRLQSELEVRQSVINLAKQGSSPAQSASIEIIKQSQAKMLDL